MYIMTISIECVNTQVWSVFMCAELSAHIDTLHKYGVCLCMLTAQNHKARAHPVIFLLTLLLTLSFVLSLYINDFSHEPTEVLLKLKLCIDFISNVNVQAVHTFTSPGAKYVHT